MASILGPPKVGVRRLWQARGTKQTTKGDPLETVPGPESTSTTPPSELNLKDFEERFPGVIQDGVLDAAGLGAILGIDVSAPKDAKERFGLMWAGKQDAIQALMTPSFATLKPDLENSINWDTAENVFIEGDNLEVLKLLQNAYNDQVKLIYIDPPYNTGNDFVYKDDFSDPIKHYLEVTGQVDAEGNKLVANTETSGRKHSNWLTMMYPRLVLARNLLTQDGLIMVSCDDNEIANLTLLMNEIFGEENRLNVFVWVSNLKGRQISGSGAAGTKEYILCYSRSVESAPELSVSVALAKKTMPSVYKGFDYEIAVDAKGEFVVKNELFNTNSAFNEETRPNLVYRIYFNPTTSEVKTSSLNEELKLPGFVKIEPKVNNNGTHKYHAFRWGRDKVEREHDDLLFVEKPDGYRVFTKVREFTATTMKDLLMDVSTSSSQSDFRSLDLSPGLFDFPKPTSLLIHLISSIQDKNALVLDFFGGSGSTGHAVNLLNEIDKGSRKYICITLGEENPDDSEAKKSGFAKISDIARERLKRSAQNSSQGRPTGLKTLTLSPSNFDQREKGRDTAPALIETTLKPEFSIPHVVTELFLSLGVRLDSKRIVKELAGEECFLAENILIVPTFALTQELIDECMSLESSVLVFLEDAFAGKDALKANAFFEAKSKNKILKTF